MAPATVTLFRDTSPGWPGGPTVDRDRLTRLDRAALINRSYCPTLREHDVGERRCTVRSLAIEGRDAGAGAEASPGELWQRVGPAMDAQWRRRKRPPDFLGSAAAGVVTRPFQRPNDSATDASAGSQTSKMLNANGTPSMRPRAIASPLESRAPRLRR